MYHRSSRCTTAPTLSFAAPCTTSRCALATRRIRCPPSDSSPAPTLQRRLRSPGFGAIAAAVCFQDFPPQQSAELRREPVPLARCQGFLHAPPPFSATPLLSPPATAKRHPDQTSRPAQPRVRGYPPAAVCFQIFPFQGPRRPAGYVSPHSSQQNRARNCFPLACSKGFLHAPPPFLTTPLLGPPATAERRPD